MPICSLLTTLPASTAASVSPDSSSFGMKPAAPQRPTRAPRSIGSRLDTSTMRAAPPDRCSATSRPLVSGKRDVEEDDVGSQALDDLDAVRSVACLADHAVAVELEEAAGGAAERLVIIDDDDRRAHRDESSHGARAVATGQAPRSVAL